MGIGLTSLFSWFSYLFLSRPPAAGSRSLDATEGQSRTSGERRQKGRWEVWDLDAATRKNTFLLEAADEDMMLAPSPEYWVLLEPDDEAEWMQDAAPLDVLARPPA